MNLTAEIVFANGTQQHIHIQYAVINNQPITDLIRYIIRKINKYID